MVTGEGLMISVQTLESSQVAAGLSSKFYGDLPTLILYLFQQHIKSQTVVLKTFLAFGKGARET